MVRTRLLADWDATGFLKRPVLSGPSRLTEERAEFARQAGCRSHAPRRAILACVGRRTATIIVMRLHTRHAGGGSCRIAPSRCSRTPLLPGPAARSGSRGRRPVGKSGMIVTERSISRRLKQETRIHQERAERHRLPQALRGGRLPRRLYAEWLAQRLLLHRVLEKEAAAFADRSPIAGRIMQRQQGALGELRIDLAFLGVDPASIRPGGGQAGHLHRADGEVQPDRPLGNLLRVARHQRRAARQRAAVASRIPASARPRNALHRIRGQPSRRRRLWR